MRRAAKVDRNQPEIVAALRKAGACVIITSQLKNAFDLLVIFRGRVFIMEVKDGEKTKSRHKLTKGEAACRDCVEAAGVNYHVVTSVEQALTLIQQ